MPPVRLASLVCLAVVLFGGQAMAQEEDEEMTTEEAIEQARNYGADELRQSGRPYRMQEPDTTREHVPKEGKYEGDTTIYMQHLLPGYNDERNWEMNESLQTVGGDAHEECGDMPAGEARDACYEENQQTPSNLGEMSEDYEQQMEEGDSPEAKAYQTAREFNEQDRYQFYSAEEGTHDPIFNQMDETLDPDSPMYESLIGDCDTVTYTQAEVERVDFEDLQTCSQVYAPDPEIFDCQAQRSWQAQVVESDRRIATITPLVSEQQCIEESELAIAACEVYKCEEAGALEAQACEISQCAGLEGEELESCQQTCQEQGDNAQQACETRGDGCGVIEEATAQLCLAEEECGSDAQCINQCVEEGSVAGQQCDDECALAGADAYESCMGELGESGIFNGSRTFDLRTFGPPSSTVTQDGLFRIETNPFSGTLPPSDPSEFAANHRVEVVGGSGEVLSAGWLTNEFRGRIRVFGEQISEIRFYADRVAIQQNSIDGCKQFMDTMADGFCAGEMVCTNDPGPCVQLAPGVTICEGSPSAGLYSVLQPWHSNEVEWGETPELAPKRCWAARSENVDCEQFVTGGGEDFCYEDVNGQERCIVGEGFAGGELAPRLGPEPYLDNCGTLIDREECKLKSQDTCAEEGEGEVTGRCYVPDVIFDCGETHWVEEEVETQREISCEGDLMCMGNECVSVKEEESNKERAVEASAVIQQMGMDTTCLQSDEDTTNREVGEDCTPVFFRGEPMECKIPIGANIDVTPNCCEEGRDAASDESYIEYMEVTSGVYASATAPGEASEQSKTETKDGDQGSHIETPDWLEIQESTYYAPPGESSGGLDSYQTAAQNKGPSQTSGEPTARRWSMDPESLPAASEEEANYATRRMTTPFEQNAARFGHVPENKDELEDSKEAAQETGDDSFQQAMGSAVSGSMSAGYAEQLFYSDGTPKYQVPRGSSVATAAKEFSGQTMGLERQGNTRSKLQSTGSFSDAISPTEAVKMGSSYYFLKKIGHIIFKCTEEEAELGMAREQRRCTYVGKYCKQSVGFGPFKTCIESREVHCCYNSAFGREFMEEYNEANDLDFGTPKDPICEGLTISELDNANLRSMDLKEWSTMMTMAGQVPGNNEQGDGGAGMLGKRVVATTSKGTRSADIPKGRYTINSENDPFREERLSPRRVIPGRNVYVAGPDGQQSVSERVEWRVRQNAKAMHATKEALRKRGTSRHDPELMPWYGETTNNPNPPHNPDVSIPPDMGEAPDECLQYPPTSGGERMLADFFGSSLQQWMRPGSTDARWIDLDDGDYAAIQIENPVEWDYFSTYPTPPEYGYAPYRLYEINLHPCPGYFGYDIKPGCRSAGQGRTKWGQAFVQFGTGENLCEIGLDGGPVYLNIKSNALEACNQNEPWRCSQEVIYVAQ